MKKIIVLFIAIVTCMSLVGCSGEKEAKESPKKEEVKKEEVQQETEEHNYMFWVNTIPDPYAVFPDKKVSTIYTEPGCYFTVEDYADGDFEKYVDAAMDMGFNQVSYRGENDTGDKMFYSYSEDGKYYMNVTYFGGDINRLDIFCSDAEDRG